MTPETLAEGRRKARRLAAEAAKSYLVENFSGYDDLRSFWNDLTSVGELADAVIHAYTVNDPAAEALASAEQERDRLREAVRAFLVFHDTESPWMMEPKVLIALREVVK